MSADKLHSRIRDYQGQTRSQDILQGDLNLSLPAEKGAYNSL